MSIGGSQKYISSPLFQILLNLLIVSLQRQFLSDGKRPYGRSLIVIGPFHKAVAGGQGWPQLSPRPRSVAPLRLR